MQRGFAFLLALAVACEPKPASDGDADADADLDTLEDAGPDGDADATVDADVEAPVDGDTGDDADVDEWDTTHGCGEVEPTEERWLVATMMGSVLRTYLTGRDCADPVMICRDCYGLAISPSGSRAVLTWPSAEWYSPRFDLGIVDLDDPSLPVDLLGIDGAHASWVDENHLVYVAESAGSPAPCFSSSMPNELTDIRSYDLRTGEETILAERTRRAWWAGSPMISPGGRFLFYPVDMTPSCRDYDTGVLGHDLETGASLDLDWTFDGDTEHLFGLLPDGGGFLLQHPDTNDHGPSPVYAILWSGSGRRISEHLEGVGTGAGIAAPFEAADEWGHCATVRRLGPACEYYCFDITGQWTRHTVDGAPPEPFECLVEDEPVRIMDVWQR